MTKCVQYCIGKYIEGSGLFDPLVETKVFGANVAEQVLDGKHYARCINVF